MAAWWGGSSTEEGLRAIIGVIPLGEKETRNGHVLKPGDLGENVTTKGIDLLKLPESTLLTFVNPGEKDDGNEKPTIRVTGLRNPCPQIDKFSDGLREECLLRNENREIVGRKAGIMAVVEVGGEVKVGAEIEIKLPQGERKALSCV
jgi:MOSC domain-containing protein YiiM